MLNELIFLTDAEIEKFHNEHDGDYDLGAIEIVTPMGQHLIIKCNECDKSKYSQGRLDHATMLALAYNEIYGLGLTLKSETETDQINFRKLVLEALIGRQILSEGCILELTNFLFIRHFNSKKNGKSIQNIIMYCPIVLTPNQKAVLDEIYPKYERLGQEQNFVVLAGPNGYNPINKNAIFSEDLEQITSMQIDDYYCPEEVILIPSYTRKKSSMR